MAEPPQGIVGQERALWFKAERSRRYRARHPERVSAANRTYHQENYDSATAVEKVRRWRERNPERRRVQAQEDTERRRARLRGVLVERVDRQIVWERDEGVCGICGEAADPDDWHLDHVIPISRGGEHSYANTQVSHPSCNRWKGDR